MRRLIVNADDFGYTSGVNRAIVEAHLGGIVTSATLMANGAAFTDAVQSAAKVPRLSIGCHIVLTDGEPVLESSKLRSITNGSHFRVGMTSFALRATAGRMDAAEIVSEVSAQIRRIQLAGIEVSHVDTHKHTHLFPKVLRPILRAAGECGVRCVRNPFGPRLPLNSNRLLARPGLWTRALQVFVLSTFAGKFRKAVDREGFRTPDGTLGVVVTGVLDETLFLAIARSVPEGTWEFVCHPGYNDADLDAAHTRLRQSREVELRVLTLPAAREVLEREGIELISYRELACH